MASVPNNTVQTGDVDASATPSAATNVINNDNQSPYKRRGTPRPRTFNDSGVQTIKGGSPIGAGFFDSIQTAYTNLVNSPFALALIIFGSLALISFQSTSLSPFSLSFNALLATARDTNEAFAIRSIATFFVYFFNLFMQYEGILAPLLVLGGIYVAKPSTNNAWTCSIACLIVWLGNFTPMESLLLCHCVLLYTQIRNPSYKIVFGFAAIVCIILGFSHISLMMGLSGLTVATPGGSGNATG